MVFIITTEAFPNGLAATQRIKCYAKCIASKGVSCEVICANRFAKDSSYNAKAEGTIDGYKYKYIGGNSVKSTLHLFALIQKAMDYVKLLFFLYYKITKEDTVILYTYNKCLIKQTRIISQKKGYGAYFEINEHPSIWIRGFRYRDGNQNDQNKLHKLLDGYAGILCISTSLKKLLLDCGINENKIHIINIVVASIKMETSVDSNNSYVAYCGAADNSKDGVDRLIKAFEIVSKIDKKLKLYIIGPKRKDCNNEQLVELMGLSDKVVFTGFMDNQNVRQILGKATLLALCRPNSVQAQYGFPTKLGEYLLSGVPVVVTKVGDIPLFLIDKVSALLSEQDISSFAEKMCWVLNNKAESKLIGERGKLVAEREFSEINVGSQLCHALGI